MRPLHKNAIKLAKYAIDRAGLKSIKSYEVEMACLNSNYMYQIPYPKSVSGQIETFL